MDAGVWRIEFGVEVGAAEVGERSDACLIFVTLVLTESGARGAGYCGAGGKSSSDVLPDELLSGSAEARYDVDTELLETLVLIAGRTSTALAGCCFRFASEDDREGSS